MATIAFVGWLVSVCLPGGIYVNLPVGIAFVSAVALMAALRSLVLRKATSRWRAYSQLILSLAYLIAFAFVYLPLWPYAIAKRDHAAGTSAKHAFAINNAELIRDAGRKLLRDMRETSTKTVFPSSAIVPASLKRGDPIYMLDCQDSLLVVLTAEPGDAYLLIFPNDFGGYGTTRLAPGIWLCKSDAGRRITDAEWDAGVRQ